MRKFMLVAAIFLTSTASYAGPSRGLSLASADPDQPTIDQQQQTPQTSAVQQPAATAPAPAPAPAPQTETRTPATDERPSPTSRPKRRSDPIEARIIYELHRHGIYW
jgi:hypothetical protein